MKREKERKNGKKRERDIGENLERFRVTERVSEWVTDLRSMKEIKRECDGLGVRLIWFEMRAVWVRFVL